MSAPRLTVPRPCHESWDAMTPAAAGRHCAACQQVVVDFTRKTDAEILAYLARTGASSCGRFRADQLGRPLTPPAAPSRWRSWLASVLALGGVLGAGRAAAQTRSNYAGPLPAAVSAGSQPATPAAAGLPTAEPALAAVAPISAGRLVVLQGRVVDDSTGAGLPGVTVLVKGTIQGTSTNADGNFSLAVTGAADSIRLAFSFIGYTTVERLAGQAGELPVVRLQQSGEVTTGIIIVGGYYARKPWPWHPRALFNWTRYQLVRPFRR